MQIKILGSSLTLIKMLFFDSWYPKLSAPKSCPGFLVSLVLYFHFRKALKFSSSANFFAV